MVKLQIVLDSMPRNFGLSSGDWASLFLSRLHAKPLLERDESDAYRLRGIAALDRLSSDEWAIDFVPSSRFSAKSVLESWRTAAGSGHRSAFQFMRGARVASEVRLVVRCAREYVSIRPFLDSPWLWIGMRESEVILSREQRSCGAGSYSIAHAAGDISIDVRTDMGMSMLGDCPTIGGGLPIGPQDERPCRPIDVEFAILPGSTAAGFGPLMDPQVLWSIRRRLIAEGLVAPSRGISESNASNLFPTGVATESLAYTDFPPNRNIAETVAERMLSFTGKRLALVEGTYGERYTGYSPKTPGAELVPLVPTNSSCTAIPRLLWTLTKGLLPNTLAARLLKEIIDIELDAESSEAQARASLLGDVIARSTGYGTLGRYLGWFPHANTPAFQISSAGFIDLEGLLDALSDRSR